MLNLEKKFLEKFIRFDSLVLYFVFNSQKAYAKILSKIFWCAVYFFLINIIAALKSVNKLTF
jgi:hypothetical protein